MKQTGCFAILGLCLLAVSGFFLIRLGSSSSPWMRKPPEAHPIGDSNMIGFKVTGVRQVGADSMCRLYYSDAYTGNQEQFVEAPGIPGGVGVWVDVDLPQEFTTNLDGMAHVQRYFTAAARLPGGPALPLQWQIREGPNRHFLFIVLPASYPDTVKSIEVEIRNVQGRSGRWKIDHLPPVRRVFAVSQGKVDHAESSGYTVRIRAYRDPQGNIWFHVRPHGAPVPGRTWDLSTPVNVSAAWGPADLDESAAPEQLNWVGPEPGQIAPSAIGDDPGAAPILPSDSEAAAAVTQTSSSSGPVWHSRNNTDHSYTFGSWPAPFAAIGDLVRFTVYLRENDISQGSPVELKRMPLTFTVPTEAWKKEWIAPPAKAGVSTRRLNLRTR